MDIKKAIKKSGFTISKVAEKLGIAQPSLTAQLINGTMSLTRPKEIADILGVSLSELLADENDQQGISVVCPHCGKPITLHIDK
ncbi:helix-turn-helix domain-containing protein [Prevotella sp.]|uniref:helix-turn-helix domain-containing protein n=1 Tax=Prevotella sp. TaxID=59823 RepID=UPI004028FFC1